MHPVVEEDKRQLSRFHLVFNGTLTLINVRENELESVLKERPLLNNHLMQQLTWEETGTFLTIANPIKHKNVLNSFMETYLTWDNRFL